MRPRQDYFPARAETGDSDDGSASGGDGARPDISRGAPSEISSRPVATDLAQSGEECTNFAQHIHDALSGKEGGKSIYNYM